MFDINNWDDGDDIYWGGFGLEISLRKSLRI